MTKFAVCEMISEFNEDFDGSLCRVKKVLQVFDTHEQAEAARAIFDPSRYGDYDTIIRVVPEAQLEGEYR